MTPDDVAAIRASLDHNGTATMPAVIRALCTALEQAWAEREFERQTAAHWHHLFDGQRERAERAEANLNIDHWATERDRLTLQLEIKAKKALEQHAALARVRALCCDPTPSNPRTWRYVEEIRAAIEGDHQ